MMKIKILFFMSITIGSVSLFAQNGKSNIKSTEEYQVHPKSDINRRMLELSKKDFVSTIEYSNILSNADTLGIDSLKMGISNNDFGNIIMEKQLNNRDIVNSFPETGYIDSDGYVVLNEKSLIAVMFEVIQNQAVIINDLNKRVSKLENHQND